MGLVIFNCFGQQRISFVFGKQAGEGPVFDGA